MTKKSKDPILVLENKKNKIILENGDTFNALMTLGLDELNDFYLEIHFQNLNETDYKKLAEYWKLKRSIKFSSDIVNNGDYNISHIVITDSSTNNCGEMSWKCLSDDPNLSLILDA